MGEVSSSRELKFSNNHPRYQGLTIGDLDKFISGLYDECDVDVDISVVQADRGGSDQITVTLSVRT